MKRFVEGTDRGQSTLFPECLEDLIDENNPVQVIDVFVDELDLAELGFDGVAPEVTGRPSYHPSVLLKLYIYGYLNRVQSSRRLEREAGRNVEVMWLTGRLVPDHYALPDEDAAAGCLRDGPARIGLQSHPRHEHSGHPLPHGGDEGIVEPGICAGSPTHDGRQNLHFLPKRFYTTKTLNGRVSALPLLERQSRGAPVGSVE